MLNNRIKIDGEFKESYVTVFFAGNKEEIILKDKKVLLWCQEYDTYEEWLKLDVKDSLILKKYLSNEEVLLNLIKKSDLYLYKRYYSDYNELVFNTELSFDDAKTMEIVLPNEKATLGYNFLDKYNNKIYYFNNIHTYHDILNNDDGVFMNIENNTKADFSKYFQESNYENTSLERVS